MSAFHSTRAEAGIALHQEASMLSWFKRDPAKALEKRIAARYEEAVAFQRNGKLREYGDAMKEIEDMEAKLTALKVQAAT